MGIKAAATAITMKKNVLIPYDRYVYYQSLAKEPREEENTVTEPINTGTPPAVPTPVAAAAATQPKLKPEIIIAQLPKRNKSKARSLLSFLEQNNAIDWNQRGELLIENESVPYSHITDLLHDALNNTKYKPVGCEQFYSNLGHVPLSLITNPARKQIVGGSTLPPPGVPDTEAKSLDSWKLLWQSH